MAGLLWDKMSQGLYLNDANFLFAAFVVGGIAAIVAVLLAKLIWKLLESHASVKLFAFALEFDVRRLFSKKKHAQAAQETDGDQDLE